MSRVKKVQPKSVRALGKANKQKSDRVWEHHIAHWRLVYSMGLTEKEADAVLKKHFEPGVVDDEVVRIMGHIADQALPRVLRRPSEMFDGKSALDWMLDGRIREVADRIEGLINKTWSTS